MRTQKLEAIDLIAIIVCALAWGTTWFAITLQFGPVDSVVSIVYRFALAAALLFVWGLIRREKLTLNGAQHRAAFGVGLFTFAVDYTLVYWAEERVTSAVVAVMFAALAFINLIAFRFVFRERTALLGWIGAALGIAGVAFISWSELVDSNLNARALSGVLLALGAVLFASIGNMAARQGEKAETPLIASTAWAMLYGASLLALFALITGRAFNFDPSLTYVLSLLHLSVIGSVVAFLLYFTLARRRGYATASYISALTPLLAMIISSVFEAKTWGWLAFVGVALVLAGQVLLLRGKRS